VRKRLIRRPSDSRPRPGGGGAEPGPEAPAPAPAVPARRIARDRRGRGLRGPLAPAGSPLSRSRSEAFNDLVLDAVERLEVRWRKELAAVEFAVEAVPTGEGSGPGGPEGVTLSRLYNGGAGRNARIILYRRPIEARATTRPDLAVLVQDLVVEQVADLLGIAPETVDPDYGLD
jgi:predicted Zn-dependent protease with MMP-like domain